MEKEELDKLTEQQQVRIEWLTRYRELMEEFAAEQDKIIESMQNRYMLMDRILFELDMEEFLDDELFAKAWRERNAAHATSLEETQGRKGHKSPRINMAFSPDNHAWIKTRSRQLGISATEFVNSILDTERTKG